MHNIYITEREKLDDDRLYVKTLSKASTKYSPLASRSDRSYPNSLRNSHEVKENYFLMKPEL